MSVTKEFAVKIDTELSDLYNKIWVINSDIRTYRDYIKTTKVSRWTTDDEKAQRIAGYNNKIDALIFERAPLDARVSDLNDIYNQDPWTRAFLVINANGHIHSSMDCNTCFSTTRYTWLIQYSNDNEADIVSDAGKDACTVCYPSAPAEVLNRPSRVVTADKIAKAQAKAERDAKREAKIAKAKASAPTASGESLYINNGRYNQEIKTERTAIYEFNLAYSYANQEIITHYYDGKPHTQESINEQMARRDHNNLICEIIAQSLAEKHGVSFDSMWNKLIKKAKVA